MSIDTTFSRYAPQHIIDIWSDDNRYRIWRRLWLAIATQQRKLGLTRISEEAIDALSAAVAKSIDYKVVAFYEQALRHDVMAHIKALEEDAPAAKGIIHLGATSCDITDNADLIIIKESLVYTAALLRECLKTFSQFITRHAETPCLGFTHYQPAQLTTIGKRAALWAQDLYNDAVTVSALKRTMRFKGLRGATGTQASYLTLFDSDEKKVDELETAVMREFGFTKATIVCGQTYSRKFDTDVLTTLAAIGESCAKMGNDIRLLQHDYELSEPSENTQVGSSAMAYKQNPMRSERMCSLSRMLTNMVGVAYGNSTTQWLERTLDDSANRRLMLPQAFMLATSIIRLAMNIMASLKVNEEVVAARVQDELPFIATEEILMETVKAGLDREVVHETIRRISREEQINVRKGEGNRLLERIYCTHHITRRINLDPKRFVGRAPQQAMKIAGNINLMINLADMTSDLINNNLEV